MNFMNFFANMGKKERIGFTIAALIVFAALFDRLVIAPIGFNFKKSNAEIKMNERQLVQGLRNLSQKDNIIKEYQKYLPYISSNYSEGEEVAKLLEDIESMGRDAGVAIADIKPRPPKQVDIYRYYLIEIEVEGEMTALMNFLHQLGSSKQLYRVSRVYISTKTREQSAVKTSILVTKVVVQPVQKI